MTDIDPLFSQESQDVRMQAKSDVARKFIEPLLEMKEKPVLCTPASLSAVNDVLRTNPPIAGDGAVLTAFTDFICDTGHIIDPVCNPDAKLVDEYSSVINAYNDFITGKYASAQFKQENEKELIRYSQAVMKVCVRQSHNDSALRAAHTCVNVRAMFTYDKKSYEADLKAWLLNEMAEETLRFKIMEAFSKVETADVIPVFKDVYGNTQNSFYIRTNAARTMIKNRFYGEKSELLSLEGEQEIFEEFARVVLLDDKEMSNSSIQLMVDCVVENGALQSKDAQKTVINTLIQKARTAEKNDVVHEALRSFSEKYPSVAGECVNEYVKTIFRRKTYKDNAHAIVSDIVSGDAETPFIMSNIMRRKKARRIVEDYKAGLNALTGKKQNEILHTLSELKKGTYKNKIGEKYHILHNI